MLPSGTNAIVDLAKIRDYCLNPHHARGKHKARVFASALGFTKADAGFLREELLRAARECEAEAGDADEYGERWIVDVEVVRLDRKATVRSAWIVLRDDTVPRLTTCFVL
jgi:hypothetical protein